MLLNNKKNIQYILILVVIFLLFSGLLFYIMESVQLASKTNKNTFSNIVKVRNSTENIDKIFERAEVNVNILGDSISNSYDIDRQQDKTYNLEYLKDIDGLIKSVLANSPGVDAAWFQVNADLPFSACAYNWYEFSNNEFVNLKDKFEGNPESMDRKITPEDDPYYFDAINTKRPTWSDIYTDTDSKMQMMTISSPVFKNGVLVGVVGIDISINNLQQAIKTMQSELNGSEVFLLNKNNKVILSQSYKGSNVHKANYPFVTLFENKPDGQIEYNEQLIEKTAIKITLSNNYKVVIAFKNSSLFEGFNRLFMAVYSLFILSVLLIAAVMFCIYKVAKMKDKVINDKPNLETIVEKNPENIE